MSERIDEIESRLRELGVTEPAAEPPVRDSGPVEGAPGEPGGSPAATATVDGE
jgi:hypothetical protein